ncbi:MAG: RGCVC family protein [Jatrophihabitans sp.]
MATAAVPRVPKTPAADVACVCCAHTWSSHDALGRRFCTATQAHALTRSCICAAA